MKLRYMKEVKIMAYGECCSNCRHCEYSPEYDIHEGKHDKQDWYCNYYGKWLSSGSGCCKNFEEN